MTTCSRTAQLGPARPSVTRHVPIGWQYRREGGPGLTIYGDPAEGQAGLIQVFETCGSMLAAVVAATPADRMSFHNYGTSDTDGFAAMGVVEVLVHMDDVASGLGLDWSPPADLCTAAVNGLVDFSLRRAARAAATTHKVLLYHFDPAPGRVSAGADAARVRCPLLAVVCDQDQSALAAPAVKAAGQAPPAELVRLPGGHYAPFLEQHERAIEAEVAFLRTHLAADLSGRE